MLVVHTNNRTGSRSGKPRTHLLWVVGGHIKARKQKVIGFNWLECTSFWIVSFFKFGY